MMAKIIEVTNDVDHENPDDEELPITKCVCGAEFKPWEHTISIYPEDAYECPKCGVKLYFIQTIKIYQIVEKEVKE
jgi:DNA-directed RNA polymerase subunit RPC12/RpoP